MKKISASYTIEAAIYIPFIVFLMFQTVELSIGYWQKSMEREIYEELQKMDTVKEFHFYQMIEEVEKEVKNHAS